MSKNNSGQSNLPGSSNSISPSTQLPTAAPSISAEQQWLQTVHAKKALPPLTAVSSSGLVQPSSFAKQPFPTPPKPVPTEQHVYFGKGVEDSKSNMTSDWVAQVTSTSNGEFPQTPNQLLAQKRMQLMQQEIDTVIGMMTLDLDSDAEDHGKGDHDHLLSRPDKKLSELFHLECADYPYKDRGKQVDDKGDGWRKCRNICLQLGVVLIILLLMVGFFYGDYLLSQWFVTEEADQELKESLARMTPANGTEIALMNSAEESTTVTIVEEIEEEDVKATVDEGGDESGGEDDSKEMWNMLGQTYAKGHDVLDAAAVEGTNNEPQLVASNGETEKVN